MVELAFVIIIFLMILLGIAEFGAAFMVNQAMVSAARECARTAAVTEDPDEVPFRGEAAAQGRLVSAGIRDGEVDVVVGQGRNANIQCTVIVNHKMITGVDQWFGNLNMEFRRMSAMRSEN
jgi:Flp pilus assembly protein TadG